MAPLHFPARSVLPLPRPERGPIWGRRLCQGWAVASLLAVVPALAQTTPTTPTTPDINRPEVTTPAAPRPMAPVRAGGADASAGTATGDLATFPSYLLPKLPRQAPAGGIRPYLALVPQPNTEETSEAPATASELTPSPSPATDPAPTDPNPDPLPSERLRRALTGTGE